MRHLRALKICSRGARSFWRDHGFDWSDFCSNVIAVESLEATRDPWALKVSALARKDADGRG
jgi:hypothetical protein